MVDYILLGEATQTLGEILIALMVLGVHHRVRHRHKIDRRVFEIMKFEQFVGALGVMLILAGFVIEHAIA